MESLRHRRKAVPTSISMKNHERFYPARTIMRRRLSDTTDFYDTDFETGDSDEESLQQSLQSLGYDSHTTLSTPDLPSPDEVLRNNTSIKFEKGTVQGPSGPHLFRNSRGSSIYEPSTAEIDLYFERSPLQSAFSQSIDSPNPIQRFPFSPRTPKALTTLQPDVSQVEEGEIRNWKPSQVAHWLFIAGYNDAVIEKFIINDISGAVLLTLQIDDLKELNILSFGIRHQLLASIEHLKNTMMTQENAGSQPAHDSRESSSSGQASPNRRSYTMSVSPTGEVLAPRVYGQAGNQITPAESVSIVGIEQLLPRPHNCSKGEDCAKYKRRQRQLEKLAAEFPDAIFKEGAIITGSPGNPETARNLLRPKSEAEPSVVASSDILGPGQGPRLSEAALQEVQKLDPQETIRSFLKNQHVSGSSVRSGLQLDTEVPPAGPFAGLTPPSAQQKHVVANLRNLPKLTIPSSPDTEDMTTAVSTNRSLTPTRASQLYGSPTAVQQYGPFSHARNIDYYRQGTPFSEMDVPVTAIPNGPIPREISQSVPPDMHYGNLFRHPQEPVPRSASVRPRATTSLRRVQEDKPLTPIEGPADLIRSPRMNQHGNSSKSSLSSDPDVTHSGWMKKRKTTRLLRHEWQDAHFTLRGTNLAMHKDEIAARRNSRALDIIDVDDYAVACSSLATSSKLTAAFKRSILRSGNNLAAGRSDAAFAFSLIPATKENEKKALFGNGNIKNHHFAVKSREQRIDWMRELMLAKALKKGKESGDNILVNGNVI
ncbi:hypothetical protein N7474_008234 [Penicillium riverlandense]|uniref:uncharacterized protein n=1 Tax=Penicillium riverlandense TaxID=1903569 RepID=UPI0025472D0A|nr:uncharacterized protein N7474_008234 [Penicillium riverlandense]KAJ5811933.1 hypothetical protein N7474_008234 [Penicillium riverlandense]